MTVQSGRKTVARTITRPPSPVTWLKLNSHLVTSVIDVVGPVGEVPTMSPRVASGYCAWTCSVTEATSARNPATDSSALTVPAGLPAFATTASRTAGALGAACAVGRPTPTSPAATTAAANPVTILRTFIGVLLRVGEPPTWWQSC